MKVLIIGATGHVGQHTVSAALGAGHTVTAFGRSIDKIDIYDPALRIVKGDATVAADLARVMSGQDVVITTHGAPLNKDTLLHVPSLMEESTRLIIAAMEKAGVPRLVCMTSLGAGDSVGHGRFLFRNVIEPVVLGRIMEDRTAQEEVVRASNLPEWVIVRPTELADGEEAPVRVITDLERDEEPGTITRKDVGRELVRLVKEKGYDKQAIVITN